MSSAHLDRDVSFELDAVRRTDGVDGDAAIEVRGRWVGSTVRALAAPVLEVRAFGATAHVQPVSGSAPEAILAGPAPEPWRAAYRVDPALLGEASLSLVLSDGVSFPIAPSPETEAPVPPAAADGSRNGASPHAFHDGVTVPPRAETAPGREVPTRREAVRGPDVGHSNGSTPTAETPHLSISSRGGASERVYWRGQEVLSGPMLEVRGISKSYGGVAALRDVDLNIDPGEILALVGSNGAGKTTLVSIIAGLLPADVGSIRVGGLDAYTQRLEVSRLLGIAPQELGLYMTLSARQNLRYLGRLAGVHPRVLEERIAEVADALSLQDLLEQTPQRMSGGERRRLHTAMAMLHRPTLLVLDEPTAGVDVQTRGQFLDAVRRLAGEGTAVLYTTHYLSEVEHLNASVAVLERGQVIARGTVAELVARAGTASLELRFSGTVPLELCELGQVDGGTLRMQTRDSRAALDRASGVLSAWSEQIAGIHVTEPSFESAYLAILGQSRPERGEPGAP